MARFVFLDRDGTLIRDAGYAHEIADCEILPGTVEGLRQLAEAGFGLVIVTNQSGIGRGYFDEAAFETFQAHFEAELAKEGIRFAATYHCPHAPDAGCDCRKPEPGMLWRAREELGADLARCWVVGDTERDVGLAERAGCAGAVRVGPEPSPGVPHAPDLAAAARWILTKAPGTDPAAKAPGTDPAAKAPGTGPDESGSG